MLPSPTPKNRQALTELPRLVIDRVYTRDAKVPLFARDDDLEHGWQSISVPPTLDDAWTVFDRSKAYRTATPGLVQLRSARTRSRFDRGPTVSFKSVMVVLRTLVTIPGILRLHRRDTT
jgi:hypothetical protein